jgi:hypothetical protein
MMTPQEPAGKKEGAKVDALMGIKMLEKAFHGFTAQTKEGKVILKVLGQLTKEFGQDEDKTEELMPEEIKQLIGGLAGPGQPPGPPGGGAPPPGARPPMPGAGAPPPG